MQDDMVDTTRVVTTTVPGDRTLDHASLQVLAALAGKAPLPWAGPNHKHYRHELGQLAETVMQLLNRDPSHRATARQVQTACTH